MVTIDPRFTLLITTFAAAYPELGSLPSIRELHKYSNNASNNFYRQFSPLFTKVMGRIVVDEEGLVTKLVQGKSYRGQITDEQAERILKRIGTVFEPELEGVA